jgi:hypothetical protein
VDEGRVDEELMPLYKKNPIYVEAWKITSDNLEELLRKLPVCHGAVMREGNYLVKNKDDEFHTVCAAVFESHYTLTKKLPTID